MDQLHLDLWQACLNEDKKAVKEALDKGADINWKHPGRKLCTCLHNAVRLGHKAIIEYLLGQEAEPDTISENGYTPLMIACENGSMDLVQLLLEHGASTDLKGTAHGYTALHCAVMHNHPAVVKLLLDKGANPNTLSKNSFSPLISAAKRGLTEIVQQLIQWSSSKGEKIDVSQSGPEGNMALHIAAENSHLEVVKILVKEGNLDKLNQNGEAPLHLASSKGNREVVQLLVEYGANQSIQNKNGMTPIELAEKNNHHLTVSVLNNSKDKSISTEAAERQQLEADNKRLTSDKADLLTKLQCCEEDLKRANELSIMREKAMSGMMAAVNKRNSDVEEREERISHLEKELEELRRKGVEKVAQTAEERTNPIEAMKPKSTVDSAVQANYLAVAPDFLRGVEVCEETVLEVVGDKPQKVEWPGYGFYIEVPEGALPPGVTASVGVKVILAGQFKLPENKQLISAFYWVSSSEVFLKEVAVNIQHCAFIRSEEQCSVFKFIIAKCSQKDLPYIFKEREGLFNSHTQYAGIKLKQFSILGVVAPTDTIICCAAFMYYKQRTDIPLYADFHFVLVKNLSSQIQEVAKKYQQWKEDNSLRICFKENENVIKFDLKQQKVDSWEIVPLTAPQITKDDVTDYKEGRIIPHCAFECRLTDKETCKRIFHKVYIIGATIEQFFYIRYCYTEPKGVQPTSDISPAEPVVPSSGAAPILQSGSPLTVNVLLEAVSNVTDYHGLGRRLDLTMNQLRRIELDYRVDGVERMMAGVFDVWLKSSPSASWADLITALRVMGEDRVASDIAARHTPG